MKISEHNTIYRAEYPHIDTSSESQFPHSVFKNMKVLNTVCMEIRDRSTSPDGLGVQELSKNHCWSEVYANVDQAALKDAHQKMSAFSSICNDYGITIIPRNEKTKKRVDEKNDFANMPKNIERAGHVDHFKVVSDFMAGRVHCKVTEIEDTVNKFKKLASENDGWCVVRGDGNDTYGAHKKNGEFKNIVQYLFVYLPKMGHVTEIQIGHEFTGLTFTIDSFLRDNKDKFSADQLPVKIWGDITKGTNLYDTVKNYLLLQSQDPENPELPAKKKECQEVAQRLYAGSAIPEDVKKIINNL